MYTVTLQIGQYEYETITIIANDAAQAIRIATVGYEKGYIAGYPVCAQSK